MNDSLTGLLEKAKNNPELKSRIYATRTEHNPVNALCVLATAEGFPITAAELIDEGETSCAAMLRSVNGGGVEAPDGWDDLYEMFFAALAIL
ncbi:MAG: Nif11-like leader peptide family natural product precursor [Oscillospiraceae bacterium]